MTIHPDDDRDFRQLGTGTFNRAVALNPTFEARLRAQLRATTPHAESSSDAKSSSSPGPASTPAAAPRRHPSMRSRWIRSLEPAAALLLVASLALGAIWFRPEQTGSPEPTQLGAGHPDSSFTAREGTRQGDAALDADAFDIRQVGPYQPFIGWQSWVFGDQMVQIGSTVEDEGGNGAFWVRNLKTGLIDFGQDGNFSGPVIATDTEFLVVQSSSYADPPLSQLVAFDRTTGGISRTLFESRTRPADSALNTLASVDGTVFVSDSVGAVTAIDISTGAALWTTPGEELQESPKLSPEGSWGGGSIVATPDDIFVATANHTLRNLATTDGEIVEERTLLDLSEVPQSRVKLHLSGGEVVVEVGLQPDEIQVDSSAQLWPSVVAFLNSKDLSERSVEAFDGLAGEIVANENHVAVPHFTEDAVSTVISVLSGDGEAATYELEGPERVAILITGASGNTLVLAGDDGLVRLLRVGGSTIAPLAEFAVSDEVPVGYLSPPTGKDGVVYITDEEGKLHAITPRE